MLNKKKRFLYTFDESIFQYAFFSQNKTEKKLKINAIKIIKNYCLKHN